MRINMTTALLRFWMGVVLTASCITAQAQWVQTLKPDVYINDNCNGYIESLPQDYATSGQTYPLLLFFGGIGQYGDGSYTDLQKFFPTGYVNGFPVEWIKSGDLPSSFTVNGQTFKMIVITPQWKFHSDLREPTPLEVNNLIDFVLQRYRVNTSRIYLSGASSGGGPVWEYAAYSDAFAKRVAGIVPFAGTSTPTYQKGRTIAGANLPVWAFHNRYDDGVPVSLTLDYINYINQPPAPNPPAKATIFDQTGHDCWFNQLRGTWTENGLNVYQWMLQYSRGTAPANQPPVANAGPDKTITLPTSSVTLSGSGTDADGSIASYSWTKVSGPAGGSFTAPSSASTNVTGLVQGTYTFRLTVQDNAGATASDDVVVTVNAAVNQAPTANAGSNQTITLPANSVTLNGSGSDPDGSITSYAWSKVSGPVAFSFTSPNTASTGVTGLTQGAYVFRLTVTDNGGATATSDVTITVNASANQTPTANAGPDKTITLPTNSVTLTGSGSDPDGSIASYSWSKISGPAGSSFGSPGSASTTVNGLAQGTYTFRLTVTDNLGAIASDDVLVTVNAATGGGTTTRIEAENWTAMSGVQTEVVYDAGGGLDVGWIDLGDWMDYSVTVPTAGVYTMNFRIATPNNGAQFQVKNAGGTVLATVNVPNTGAYQTWQTTSAAVSLQAGTQTIRLQSSAQPAWNINWLEIAGGTGGNVAPVANAGPDQTITLPASSVTLNGSGSDVGGSIASYAWTKISGPAGGTIGSPSSASTTVSGLTQGTYTFRLTVTDNLGATGTDDVNIVVNGSTIPPSTSIHIEAENWTAMSGVQTETVYDAGGGLDVGWIDPGDWMEYSINPSTSGTYTFKFRIATPNNGAQFQVKNAAGVVLAIVNVPNTGAYQTWQTTSVTINLSAGQQTIRLQSSASPGWNINWFDIVGGGTPPPPVTTTRIEAENWTAMSGVQTETVYDAGGGLNVGWIDLGDWMDYTVTVPTAGTYTMNFRIATPNNRAQFQVKASNGTVLATVNVPNTGAYQTWQTTSASVSLQAGTQTIRLQSSAQPGWNINWLEVVQPSAGLTLRSSLSGNGLAPAPVSAIGVFPNPVGERFTLNVDNAYKGKMTVEIIDMKGVVQKQWALTKAQAGLQQFAVFTGDLARGSYLVRVIMNGQSQTKQIVKQ